MIIRSLLDTDLYKFTMMQVVLHHFPGRAGRVPVQVPQRGRRSHALCRRDPRRGPARFAACGFASDELDYLRGWRFFKSDFVDLLGLFQLDERFIYDRARSPGSDREIDISIKGPWLHTILFEVPVLAIVSEVYFRNTRPGRDAGRGAAAARGEDRAHQRRRRSRVPHRRLRNAAALLAARGRTRSSSR